MNNFTIKRVTIGFGFTSFTNPNSGNGKVLKYYFEPEIEFEVPAKADEASMQETLNSICADLTTMVQKAVSNKVRADKQQQQENLDKEKTL